MTWFLRSLKYFIALCVLCIALMALMLLTGTSALSFEDTIYTMFHTDRYLTLFLAIAVLAALYPRFGFVTRKIEGDIVQHRRQIVKAFGSAGFSLAEESDDRLVFRADTLLHRTTLLFEDRIEASQYGQWIVLRGIRRGVVRVAYRLESFIQTTARNE